MSGNRSLLWLCGALVVLCGAIFGYFAWNAHFNHFDHKYEVQFDQARRLIAPENASQGYFRKELFLSSQPAAGWLALAASESFTLYINGREIDSQSAGPLDVAGAYDLVSYLKPGTNVIGVEVRHKVLPGVAWFILDGGWSYELGSETLFHSDETWLAQSSESFQENGDIPWYDLKFNPTLWLPPEATDESPETGYQTLHYPPQLLHFLPDGQWLGHPEITARTVVFQKDWFVDSLPEDAWILLGSEGNCSVVINGHLVTQKDENKKTKNYKNIRPFLRKGNNTFSAMVGAIEVVAPRLVMDLVYFQGGRLEHILSTDDSWQAFLPDDSGKHFAVPLPAASISDNSYPNILPVSVDEHALSPEDLLALPFMIIIFSIVFLLLWVIPEFLLKKAIPVLDLETVLARDGLMHIIPLISIAGLILTRFDPDYGPGFAFHKTGFLAILILFAIVKLSSWWGSVFPSKNRPDFPDEADNAASGSSTMRRFFAFVVVIVLVTAGLFLRVNLVDVTSLSHDEVGIARLAGTALERGYPIQSIGEIEKPLTTYEMLPFPIAASQLLFGKSGFAVRLPAMLMGAATILLLFWVGRRLWGDVAGIFTATVYTFSPLALLWGTNSFHPQQVQFFTLLTCYLFLKAVESNLLKFRLVYASAISFIVMYLSWEGSGILLPALFLGLLLFYGKNLSWLRSTQLWLAVGAICLVVLLQLSFRILNNYPYLVVGKGLSGKTISLAFLSPEYNPWFYLQNFLFSGNQFVLTILVLVAIPFLWRDKRFSYFVVIGAFLLFVLTNFMPNTSARYIYFLLPCLLLPAGCVISKLAGMKFVISSGEKIVMVPKVLRCFFIGVVPLLVVLFSNNALINLQNLGPESAWVQSEVAPIADYRDTMQYVKRNLQPGDKIMALMPHTFEYYSDHKNDYYLQEFTQQQVLYDARSANKGYMDKFTGSQVVRGLEELKEILTQHHRVWIIASPVSLYRMNNSDALIGYLSRQTEVVYEDFGTKVYLWSN